MRIINNYFLYSRVENARSVFNPSLILGYVYMENKYCTRCKKVLQVMGNLRKNGRKHNDWDSREMHKKCWIQDRKIRMFDIYIFLQDEEKEVK